MALTEVTAPAPLLLASDLAPTAKLVWLLLTLQAGQSPAQLAAQSGLTRRTVRKCLAQLESAGWSASPAPGLYIAIRPACAPGANLQTAVHPTSAPGASRRPIVPRIPCGLLTDRRTSIQARLLYGLLQLTPGFREPSGQCTYASVGVLTGICAKTVKYTVSDLARNGWLKATQANKAAPLAFTLEDPIAERAQAELHQAKLRLRRGRYRGEAIMREYLSLLVESEQFIDDADPGFLINPATTGKLELDRYYVQGVGFEFQGPQHDHPTERFTEEVVAIQQVRDYIKLGMCVKLGITLVEVRPEELSLKTMQQKVGTLLPLRDLTGHERLVGFLERVARGYRPKSLRWVSRGSGRGQ